MDSVILTDIRYALRALRRAPTYTAGVALTIGLGLGVLGSAFTLVNSYLLRPIAVADPGSLFSLSWDTAAERSQRLTLDDVDDLRGAAGLAAIAAGQQVSAIDHDQAMTGLLVTGNYFELIKPAMLLGRGLLPADADGDGAPIVVLAERTWRSHYGADPGIVGRTVTLGRAPFKVVGVMRTEAMFTGQESTMFWAPLSRAYDFGSVDPVRNRQEAALIVARGGGTAVAPVHDGFDTWLRARFPEGTANHPVAVRVDALATRIPLKGNTLTLFTMILGAFALVLLIACANVTNLMMARALARQHDVTVRLSLGARRSAIVRQQMVESLVLAVPAAGVGVALVAAAVTAFPRLILSTFPSNVLPVDALLIPLPIDANVLIMMAIAAIGAAVVVSIAPAGRMTRTDVARMSRGEVSFDGRRSRLRSLLVSAQVATSVVFLVGAASLLVDSRRIADLDPGYKYDQVLGVGVDARLRPAFLRRLAAAPEVESVAVASRPPLIGGPLAQLHVKTTDGHAMTSGFVMVSPEYFAVFGMRIVEGRGFTALEAQERAPLAMVSAATARMLWPGASAVGQTLDVGAPIGRPALSGPGHTRVRVVGVVADVTNGLLLNGRDTSCTYFVTNPDAAGDLSILVRSRTTANAIQGAATRALAAVGPGTPLTSYSISGLVGTLTWIFDAFSTTAAVLGGIGLLLACAGTYAVISFLVALRGREFGVRMALGASAGQIIGAVLREHVPTVGGGVAAGMLLAAVVVGLFSRVLPAVPPFDALAFTAGGGAVALATLVAALVPSARAARANPAHALRVG